MWALKFVVLSGAHFFLSFLSFFLSLSLSLPSGYGHVENGYSSRFVRVGPSHNKVVYFKRADTMIKKLFVGPPSLFPSNLFPSTVMGLWMSERPPRGLLCSGWDGELSDFIWIFFSLLIVRVGRTGWGICPAVGFV